jgi:hypothetical protein
MDRIARLLSALTEQEQALLCDLLERIADGASNLGR